MSERVGVSSKRCIFSSRCESVMGCVEGCMEGCNNDEGNYPIILHKISLTRFTETPLHISALLGHVEFTKAIVSQKPQLVTELDSFKRSPLHLAAAEGHGEIVKELLIANKDVSMVADQEGRIPLHLAAMRGRVEVIQELISAKPESILVQIHGETALHLCVKHNHLDALKVLVSSVDDEEFLNSKNLEGNSILQVFAILPLAFDGICRNDTIQRNLQNNLIKETTTKAKTIQAPQKFKSIITSFFKWRRLSKHKSDRYEGTRGNLMVVATLIATMSFQITTNPPGGYWQEDTDHSKAKTCPKRVICRAGTAIHAHTDEYYYLTIASTISFSASLSIILWLISGVALRNRVSVGILEVKMWVALLFVAYAYALSISLILLVGVEEADFVAKWCCFKKKKQLDQPMLMQNGPFILHKISLTPFTETPLYISALLGHVEFTEAIVSQKPQLVAELDSFKRSPLHLAAAEGHSEIVKELLLANKDLSMFTDQEGRIPLHLAAIRGRVEVTKELISAKPESIFEPIRGETALHLCVKLNHLDAVKVLVSSVDDEEFLNSKNLEGNSILQVSTMLQQYES
ncbi:ankyrin repeat-containing protein ITN1-like [Mangifera indica]|uniref:ankyrin repeat-containing protein ITN1-like n=1 Tax=Mangifera indica TaxID=29780 RepID=UPI001CFC2D95|nr:ankyrin repeat-containing protein ITN1-like [Mangifera indica]